jgi:cell division protein FtsI (penicillin-binding protein 3)
MHGILHMQNVPHDAQGGNTTSLTAVPPKDNKGDV